MTRKSYFYLSHLMLAAQICFLDNSPIAVKIKQIYCTALTSGILMTNFVYCK